MKISANKYSGKTQVVAFRLPTELVAKLKTISKVTRRKRAEIIAYCIENLEVEE